jgi:hypothetical protein
LAIRRLCRDGFDVAAKTLSRSTIEHIDTLALIILQPAIAREFNRLKHNKASNAFWHKYLSRGKGWKTLAPVWKDKFGQDFDADGWIEWLYGHHDVLGMSVHPSFSGGMFSAVTLGSGTTDTWLGVFGDRADISADTFYDLIIHVWKLTLLASGFPFSNPRHANLAIKFDQKSEFHQHVQVGGDILFELLVSMWDPKVRRAFFKKPDTSNIWPVTKKRRKKRSV